MPGLIAHEWVAKRGGSENVVEELLRLYPDADLQVLWSDDRERFRAPTRETWLANTPLRHSKALALPLMPATWRTLTFERNYEWVLASSHLFAHHIKMRGLSSGTPKFVYVHTPARYIWEPHLDHRGANIFVKCAAALIKPLDRTRAAEADRLIANSNFTRERIKRTWRRDADVIYPPVDVETIAAVADWREHLNDGETQTISDLPRDFLLGASRFVPYKRLDLVIAAGEATGMPVVLAGGGPEESVLRDLATRARVPVTIINNPSKPLLYALMQAANLYIFPAVEDFGIMPVEAMAAGTPVVVPSAGGASESVQLLAGGSTVGAFTDARWRAAISTAESVDGDGLKQRAKLLSGSRFRSEIGAWMSTQLGETQ